MVLQTRVLGSTGLTITTVGLGTWGMAGDKGRFGWGPQSDSDSIATIHHAVDLGLNWIDTAAVYGQGHAEAIVGRALHKLPPHERPYIFTKCGFVWKERTPRGSERRVLRPDSIRRECGESLRRLGVERIDLYQCHWPDEHGTPVEETWAAMVQLVDEGKVRAVGLSNFDIPLLERCEAVGHVGSLQPPLSLIDRTAAASLLPWCAAHGTGVIVYSPLQSGLLSGAFSHRRVAELTDWRAGAEDFREPSLSRNLEVVAAAHTIAARRGTTAAAVAIAWTLAWPEVTGAIVGARRPQHVAGLCDAARLTLTCSELDELDEALRRTGAGRGPIRPPGHPSVEHHLHEVIHHE